MVVQWSNTGASAYAAIPDVLSDWKIFFTSTKQQDFRLYQIQGICRCQMKYNLTLYQMTNF